MPQRETPDEARRRIFGESEQPGRPRARGIKPGKPAPSPREPRGRLKSLRSLDRLRRLSDRLRPPAPGQLETSAPSVASPPEQPASPGLPPDEQPAASASAPQQETTASGPPSHDEPAAQAPPPPHQAAPSSPVAPEEPVASSAPKEVEPAAGPEEPVASSAPKEVEPAAGPEEPGPEELAASAPEADAVTSSIPAQEEPATPAPPAQEEPAPYAASEQQASEYSSPRSDIPRPVAGDEVTQQLSEQSSTLARHEKRLAKLERGEPRATAAIRVSPAFVAGIVAFLAAEALVAAVVLALDRDLKTWAAAGIVGLGLTVIAAVVALIAKRHVD